MDRRPIININSHNLNSLPLKNESFNGIEYGEIAVNYNSEKPFLIIKKNETEGNSPSDFAKFIDEDTINAKLSVLESRIAELENIINQITKEVE